MHTINALGIPEMKQVNLYQEYHRFVPDCFYPLICSKPSDKIIDNIKDYYRYTIQKRLNKIKTMKSEKIKVYDKDNKDLEDDKKKQYSVIIESASIVDTPKNKNPINESLLVWFILDRWIIYDFYISII